MRAAPILVHQGGFGVVVVADDLDHPVKVQEGRDQALQHLKPVVDLVHPVPRAALQHLAPVVEESAQHFLERADLGRLAIDQHVHVEREAHLKVRVAEQHPHQHVRIDVLRARLDDHADVFGGFVADIGKNRDLLGLDQFGDLFDQLGFLNLIGNFGNDNLPSAPAKVLNFPTTTQPEGAAARAVGIGDILWRLDDHATGGEIRAGDVVQQRLVAGVGRLDQVNTGVTQLGNVMRRNVRGHAHGDARRAIGQQIRKLRGQHHRFGQRAIVILTKIDGVLVQPFQHGFGHGGHPRLGIARGRRVIAVDVAKVALPVDQRIAHVEILRQTRHRVIDRGIAMRVIVPHHVARNLRRFTEAARRRQPQLAHGIKDAAVHRFQPIARIRQRPVHDRAQGIGQIPLSQGAAQRLGQVIRVEFWGCAYV